MKTIKITFLTVALITLLFNGLYAQSLEISDNIVSAGYGFPYIPSIIFSDYIDNPGFNLKTSVPYYLKFEHIFSDEVSLGINFAYASNNGTYFEQYSQYNPITGLSEPVSYLHKVDRVTFSLLFRANWYFASDNKFYAYFGTGMGYRYAKWNITSSDPRDEQEHFTDQIPFGFEATMGAKYLLSDLFSVYGEVGLAKSPIQIGLNLVIGSGKTEELNNH